MESGLNDSQAFVKESKLGCFDKCDQNKFKANICYKEKGTVATEVKELGSLAVLRCSDPECEVRSVWEIC